MTPHRHLHRGEGRRAFTLTELLVVIAIIAVLAAILFPVLNSVQKKKQSAQCVANLKQLSTALILYAQDHGNRLPAIWYNNQGSVLWYVEPACDAYLGPPGAPRFKFGMCPSWDGTRRNGIAGSTTYPPQTYDSYTYCYPPVTYASGYTTAAQYGDTPLLSRYARPTTTLLVCDSRPNPGSTYDGLQSLNVTRTAAVFLSVNGTASTTPTSFRHFGKMNSAFADGHIEALTPAQITDGMLNADQPNAGALNTNN